MKTKKERESALAIAQRIGSSLFIVIAILPVAGVLYGIGCSFTNETTIATYGLSGILHQGNHCCLRWPLDLECLKKKKG